MYAVLVGLAARSQTNGLLSFLLQAEAQIQEFQAGMEERLNSMPPSQRTQYYELVSEQQTLQQEGKRFEETIDELDKWVTVGCCAVHLWLCVARRCIRMCDLRLSLLDWSITVLVSLPD